MKGVRRDPTLFPTLTRDSMFDQWKMMTKAIANAQGVGEVLTDYQPALGEDLDEFVQKNIYMFSVFIVTLKTDKGKEPV